MLYDYGRRGRRSGRRWNLKIDKTKLVSRAAAGLVILVIFGFFSSLGLFAYYSKDLPEPDKVKEFDGLSTIIYSRNGKPLYDIYAEQNLVPVGLDEVSDELKHATIAIEDKDFYKHSGFSIRGYTRAAVRTLFLGKLEGGSTLTQQLVKNVLLSRERTLPRKIKELMLALQIERKYSKDEILEMYLNNVPYGGTSWGVKTAAESYFDKDVSELSLVESAILAGLPQAPTTYSPFGPNSTAYIERTENVLRRMKEDGYISQKEYEEAKDKIKNVVFSDTGESITAPHFVMYVRRQLVDQFGESVLERGGLRVTTSLDLDLQEEAEKIVTEELAGVESLDVSNGAVVVLDPGTGEILTMVGSKEYFAKEADEGFQGQFNVATQGLRQPGSSIKPITYATAFEKGYTPATLLVDAPTKFPGGEGKPPYQPVNYDGKYRGPMQLRSGFANSINVIAVKTLALVGVEDTLETAYGMGLSTLKPTLENQNRFGLSITLGGGEVTLLELTSAYGTFATGGKHIEPVSLLRVEDARGEVLFEQQKQEGRIVLDEGVAFLVSDILSDNKARSEVFGLNSSLNIPGRKVAAKTGTTNDLRDNWTLGYSKDFVVGVWVGNNDNSPMNARLASGITGAAPIWNRVVRNALEEREDGFLKQPESVISMQIDALGGGLPVEGQPTRLEYFIEGTEPTRQADIYRTLKVSTEDENKLANEAEIERDEYREKEFIVLEEDDPYAAEGEPNRWQEGINTWLESVEDPKYHHPTEVSGRTFDEPTATPEPTNAPTPTITPTPSPASTESPAPEE